MSQKKRITNVSSENIHIQKINSNKKAAQIHSLIANYYAKIYALNCSNTQMKRFSMKFKILKSYSHSFIVVEKKENESSIIPFINCIMVANSYLL